MSSALIIAVSIAYVGLLFLIAWWTDRQANRGRSIVNNPYVYALSLGVYCTAWTFYGSVGKAAESGINFLPVYLGPTLVAVLWWFVLRKIILISKSQRITSIADFISSRYGKSTSLGIIATVIAVSGITPYISIQLKAIAVSYDILTDQGIQVWADNQLQDVPFYLDTAWYIAIALAVFTILFGTRNLDPNERHEGLVAAVAFESLLKLVAFSAIGLFVTFGMFSGFGDIFFKVVEYEELAHILFLEEGSTNAWSWFWLMLLSMSAILFLPRQFHIAVVENTNPNFVQQAAWIFPLYLLLINVFVLPIAFGGTLTFGAGANADAFVLDLPISQGENTLALFVALGGFSASTSMVIVAVTALGIMISNHIVMPLLLSYTSIRTTQASDIADKLLGIRRVIIVMVLLVAYGYFKFVSVKYTLVSIGLISFVAVAQFAPAILGGIFWKRATKQGAIAGLLIGFTIWLYCLPLPTLVEVGLMPTDFMTEGPWGIAALRPHQLFGLDGSDQISHCAFWSLLLNTAAYVGVSLYTHLSPLEVSQADLFVNIYKYQDGTGYYEVIKRKGKLEDIRQLMRRFLGEDRTQYLLQEYERRTRIPLAGADYAGEDLIRLAETHLAGAIGAASAKIILKSIVQEDPMSLEEMFNLLQQTKEIFQYSKELEQKSRELERTTTQLKTANAQLKELDLLKADFITTVTHELRTPITSIKALAKILADNPSLPLQKQSQYLGVIVGESERIARLVNQVLDLEKLHTLKGEWTVEPVDFCALVRECALSLEQVMVEQRIKFESSLPPFPIWVDGVRDKLMQAVLNLLSNAIKFCHPDQGEIHLRLTSGEVTQLTIADNGMGISATEQELVFKKFTQLKDNRLGKPEGTGLGLPITKEIIERHHGGISIQSIPKKGATFIIDLPIAKKDQTDKDKFSVNST